MSITAELIEKAKLNLGLASDYQLATALEVDRQKISNWKKSRSEANAEMTLKLMKLSGVTVDEVLSKYEKGNASVSLLGVTGLLSTLALASNWMLQHCILCKIKGMLMKTRHTFFAVRKFIPD